MSEGTRLAIALGDPNGIGPEIALKAMAAMPERERERFMLFGPGAVLRRTAVRLGLGDGLAGLRHREVGALDTASAVPGRIDAAAGASAVASATAAIQAAHAGEFDAVIACPHHETAIAQAGIAFSGYPSLVARVCGQPADSVFLMLVGGGLRIVHVTLHESVQTALGRLSTDLIVRATQAGIVACLRLGMATAHRHVWHQSTRIRGRNIWIGGRSHDGACGGAAACRRPRGKRADRRRHAVGEQAARSVCGRLPRPRSHSNQAARTQRCKRAQRRRERRAVQRRPWKCNGHCRQRNRES